MGRIYMIYTGIEQKKERKKKKRELMSMDNSVVIVRHGGRWKKA